MIAILVAFDNPVSDVVHVHKFTHLNLHVHVTHVKFFLTTKNSRSSRSQAWWPGLLQLIYLI